MGRRKRGRETSVCGCLLHTPCWGPGLQPRHVPWPGIKPETLWFEGRHSIHWATPARADLEFQSNYLTSYSLFQYILKIFVNIWVLPTIFISFSCFIFAICYFEVFNGIHWVVTICLAVDTTWGRKSEKVISFMKITFQEWKTHPNNWTRKFHMVISTIIIKLKYGLGSDWGRDGRESCFKRDDQGKSLSGGNIWAGPKLLERTRNFSNQGKDIVSREWKSPDKRMSLAKKVCLVGVWWMVRQIGRSQIK